MVDTRESEVDWRALATAIPGAVAVQSGSAFVHVSEAFATTVGADADGLVGDGWRTLFDDEEAGRVEAALETARADGRWEGPARVRGGVPVGLTLSAVEADAVLWVAEEQVPDDPDVAGESLTERRARLYGRPAFVRSILDAIDDVVYVMDEDGQMYLHNERLAETTGYSHEAIYAMHPMELIPEDHHEYVPGLYDEIDAIEDRRVDVDILTSDGERITHEFKGTTFEDPETGDLFRCGVARDVTEQRQRERELKRQRDELATLDSVNHILLETVRQLVETTTRESVERLVCERLAGSELYRFARIDERTIGDDAVASRTAAREGPDGVDDVGGDGSTLAERAVRTAEIQVATAGTEAFEPWQGEAVASVAAVPLCHEGAVNGVLVIGSAREDAFSDRERAGLGVLGRTVGFVVDAARRRELLFADAVVELAFQVDDWTAVPFGTASALDCELALEGYVASGSEWVLYLSVAGAPVDDVVDALLADDAVTRARRLGDGDRVEVVASSSVLDAVAAAGAVVTTATGDGGQGRLVVEAPLAADVREVVEEVRRRCPGATLRSRRERERGVTTVGRPGGLLDDLTDRQREVLEATYRAGYFAWPRESTAEEVAETLGIDPSTLHAHLRKAESTVLAGLFDTDRG